MKTKLMKRLALLFVGLVLLAAACGGSNSETAETNDSESAATTDTANFVIVPGDGTDTDGEGHQGGDDNDAPGDADDDDSTPTEATRRSTTTTARPPSSGSGNRETTGTSSGSGSPEPSTPPPPTPAWKTVNILKAKPRQASASGNVPRIVVPVHNSPNGSQKTLRDGTPTDPTYWGNSLEFLVVSGRPGDDWAEVLVSSRPNQTTGWVRTAIFDWVSHDYHVRIDLSDNTLTAWEGNRLIAHTRTIIGRSSRPTPIVSTYIEASVRNIGNLYAGEAYGPWYLPIAAFSETLETFGGAIPQIAIHGTNVPDQLGTDISSGCVRVHNTVITELANELPVGTVVNIVA